VKEADHQLALEKLDNLLEQQKAASQIRATKERLGLHNWRGGLILVNSGSYTIGAEKYFKLAKRYASKDTTQIQEVICMRR
jgi:D-alanyl-D-alanine carboxypeptidase